MTSLKPVTQERSILRKWSDGYWGRLDIQPTAPHHTNSDLFWHEVVVNDQPRPFTRLPKWNFWNTGRKKQLPRCVQHFIPRLTFLWRPWPYQQVGALLPFFPCLFEFTIAFTVGILQAVWQPSKKKKSGRNMSSPDQKSGLANAHLRNAKQRNWMDGSHGMRNLRSGIQSGMEEAASCVSHILWFAY
ncbi:hypothetical protein AVEN_242604-1 [Araneus ventricosus]|uniref:Uncharacterized protein n=1 Tax=Araneus ventricosus TaxID=182803 RepID=A0A4Y2EPN1_ARAVE|nr:hypothetical protein AVEN_242604-1 [Araneus ventricosus]